MKWRNAKKVAPLSEELCLFYLGKYKYVVGRIHCVADKDHEYLILPEEDGEPFVGFRDVKEWSYITVPEAQKAGL